MPDRIHEPVLASSRRTWGTGALAAALAPSVAGRPGVTEWWGRVERFAGTPGTALAKARAMGELDVRNVLPLVAAPTLVLHSRDNTYIRVGHGRYLAETNWRGTSGRADSADHWQLPEPDLVGAIEEFITGSSSGIDEGDRFLATVLVVDVVGSTELASELGRPAGVACGSVSRKWCVRTVIVVGGEVEDVAGDGVLATFDGSTRAMRCA